MLFNLYKTEPDGNCFFHAIIKALGKGEIDTMRKGVGFMISMHPVYYDALIEDWKTHGVLDEQEIMNPNMAMIRLMWHKEWATTTVIHCIALLFNLHIMVHKVITGTVHVQSFPLEAYGKFEMKNPKLVHLLNMGQHFDLLIPSDRGKDVLTIVQNYVDLSNKT